MKKALLATLPVAAFVAGMAVVPSVFADETPCNINDESDFTTQLESGSSLKLCQGVSLTSYLKIDKAVTLDLNGQKLSRTGVAGDTAVYVFPTGDLTITDSSAEHNGSIEIDTANSQAVYVKGGGKLTVNNGSLSGTRYGIAAVDASPSVTVNDGTITGGHTGIAIFGSGANVTVNGGAITGTSAFAIAGNGKDTTNSTITINNGTLSSPASAAIYNPQSGSLTIKGGDISGVFGVVARQGDIKIQGGKITTIAGEDTASVGDATSEGEKVQLPKGVAVIVDNSENYGQGLDPAKATISGNVVISAKASTPVLAYNDENNSNNEITIEAGPTFTGSKPAVAYLAAGVELDAEGKVVVPRTPSEEPVENPNTADPIATYITVATVALLGLGAAAVVAVKANR